MEFQNRIDSILNKIPFNAKLAAFVTFAAGIVCNMFIFTNKSVNHDDIIAEFSYNDTFDVQCGRWMWLFLRKIPTYFDMPMVKGILAMLLLSLAVALIVQLLGIRQPVFAVLIAAVFAAYPINACFFSYMAISEIYYFAIFFAVLAVWLVQFGFWGIAAGAVCACMSLGSYQTMLCLMIGLVFAMALKDLLYEQESLRQWFVKYVRYAAAAVLGYVLYFIVTQISLKVYNTTLREYSGTDKMFAFDFTQLFESICKSYVKFFGYFFSEDIIQHTPYVLLNIVLAAILLYFIIAGIVSMIKNNDRAKAAVTAVMALIFPVMINMVYIMAGDRTQPHTLMWYSYILFYAACAAITDANSRHFVKSCLAALMCAGMVYFGVITSNQLYQRLYYNTKAIDSLCTTIISSLSSLDGWTVDEPVLFANVGSFLNDNYDSSAPFAQELPRYIWIGTDVYPWYTSEHLIRYMGFNQHITLKEYDGELKDEILNSQEFKDMPAMPDNGSVARINGVAVVKLDEE